ncbi:sensor histidine kinase [Halofilum ochraceum]|uniref:sensor histidine kinase n=1 Tax=Halofilum ochraceum TaxID=1611323 RepID=UPI0008DA43CA|nr:HAMP domain-containing sensor histidine kinase [Halofilum ochraceum]
MLPWIQHHSQRHRLLALALLALQVALLAPDEPAVVTAATLVHFGLIILWQPFWQGSTEVNRRAAIATLVVGTAVVLLSSWLLLAAWLLVLLGLIGGEQVGSRRDQLVQWLVILYLLMALLIGVTPPLFAVEANGDNALWTVMAAGGSIPLLLLFMPAASPPAYLQRFDYLRSLAITLLALLMAAGGVLWTYRTGTPYAITLVQTTLFVAGLILVMNWVWRRKASHTMFQVLWNRYLLNIGTPFEHYLVSLSGPAATGLGPDDYLDQAVTAMSELEWVQGVEVRGPARERLIGQRTEHATEGYDDTAPLIVYTANDPGPTLRLHIQLLARLIQQLYHSRLHEVELRNQEKVRAVHETGARLTHDIKNLLQSLQSLSAAVASSGEERSAEALQLVQRQLPDINQRLQSTLEKLREPAAVENDDSVAVSDWWEGLRRRYADGAVTFEGEADSGLEVPRDLFDTVAENLLENARYKQATDRKVTIRARLSSTAEAVALEIEDTGAPMPEATARNLFNGAVQSAGGLGVGLYQCARLAQYHGFDLRLTDNESGLVRFRLSGAPAAQSA